MKTMIAVALLMVPALAGAQINKCVDKSGKVVGYGNECPAGTRAEASGVKSSPAPAASDPKSGGGTATSQPKSLAERDAEFRKRQMEKQESDTKAQKSADESGRRKQACTDSQAYLKSLQAGNRITRTDPKTGERVFLQDAEYPGEIARAQQIANANCK
jgi:hypothetical protein